MTLKTDTVATIPRTSLYSFPKAAEQITTNWEALFIISQFWRPEV